MQIKKKIISDNEIVKCDLILLRTQEQTSFSLNLVTIIKIFISAVNS